MKNGFERGYFCAVATLLRMEGHVTTEVQELFKGADWSNADKEDIALFREHKLIDQRIQENAKSYGSN